MKGYRFYACIPEDRGSKSASKRYPFQPWTVKAMRDYAVRGVAVDCVAVVLDDRGRPLYNGGPGAPVMDAVAGVYSIDNSPCCETGISRDWLARRAVRIPAELVEKLHPELWRYVTAP